MLPSDTPLWTLARAVKDLRAELWRKEVLMKLAKTEYDQTRAALIAAEDQLQDGIDRMVENA